ncbi:MAG: hypothetical protein AAF403_05765 [Pseudomonadota bacterium]
MHQANAHPLPEADKFTIKTIAEQKILRIKHDPSNGHISNSIVALVRFYLLQASDDYNVIFPQMSISKNGLEHVAIQYEGNPKITKDVEKTTLKAGIFASYIFKGSYVNLSNAIPQIFAKIRQLPNYIVASPEEIRILYWNSIDDHHPQDLISEIQIRLQPK